jgi:hypothetical protein
VYTFGHSGRKTTEDAPLAAHESARTRGLNDRRGGDISLVLRVSSRLQYNCAHASPARLSPREHLELFVARVDDLSQTTLIQSNGLVNEWSLSFAHNQPTVFRSVQPNEDLLRSYLLSFRKFVSKDEPVYVGYIHGLCHRHFTSDELKARIKDCQHGWKQTIAQAGFKMELYGKHFTSEHIADLWINAHYFHDDPEKAKELSRYAPPAVFIVRQEFLNFVVETTRVVGSSGYVIKQALREGSVSF